MKMEVTSIKTGVLHPRDNLLNFLFENIPPLKENDILIITSKIVALSQGRVAITKDKKKLILKESKCVIKTSWAYLTLTDEGWCLNAGIDESNADHQIILAPREPFAVAKQLHLALTKHFRLRHFGILITDTKSPPLRVGTIGRAVAYAGFAPIKSYVGKADLFGKKSRFTKSNVADALAAAAVLMMGEGKEQRPLAVIKNAPVVFTKNGLVKEKRLFLLPQEDIYAKVFTENEPSSHTSTKKKHP